MKRDFKCIYLGVRAADTARFNISKFFYDVADFIDNAIKENGNIALCLVYSLGEFIEPSVKFQESFTFTVTWQLVVRLFLSLHTI